MLPTISINNALHEFEQHITMHPRTVFTARFGDGKTYFLKEFCRQKADEYFFITLHPVNYSVASNANIFEYIKRDILLQLAERDRLCSIDISMALGSLVSEENIMDAVSWIVSMLPQGELLNKMIKFGKSVHDRYEAKKQTFDKYNEVFRKQRGGIYENDGYTRLICSALNLIHNGPEHPQKTTLIIEDLDRIDPSHLFRILNVFGAQIDENSQTNKFGFDNIVFVMDYDTTCHLFHHFYGQDANYEGYMRKFLHSYPFRFSITQEAHRLLVRFLEDTAGVNSEIWDIDVTAADGGTYRLRQFVSFLSVRQVEQILDTVEMEMCQLPQRLNDKDVSMRVPAVWLLLSLVSMDLCFNVDALAFNIVNGGGLDCAMKMFGRLWSCTPWFTNTTFLYSGRYFTLQDAGNSYQFVQSGYHVTPNHVPEFHDLCARMLKLLVAHIPSASSHVRDNAE